MQNSGKNKEIEELLIGQGDSQYADFTAKLLPNVPRERLPGVRAPQLKDLAKSMLDTADVYIDDLPHHWLDENLLHAYLINGLKSYDKAILATQQFLPYVSNWSVCDALSPKAFATNKAKLLPHIKRWIASKHEYTVRFGISMLMRHFLDADFRPEYLKWVADIDRDEYYIKMMQAWYFATALAKQWKPALECLKHDIANDWVRRKAIQKALESRRLTDKQKETLRKLRK